MNVLFLDIDGVLNGADWFFKVKDTSFETGLTDTDVEKVIRILNPLLL